MTSEVHKRIKKVNYQIKYEQWKEYSIDSKDVKQRELVSSCFL